MTLKVWDIKSASAWAFKNKFAKGFDYVAAYDDFGYVVQGDLYGLGRKLPFGGWIVINKETGEWEVVEAPENPGRTEESRLDARDTALAVAYEPFTRCFTDEAETFNKEETGNRVLGVTCGFCEYKWSCWPGLKHLPQPASKAKSPPMKYYTHLEEQDDD